MNSNEKILKNLIKIYTDILPYKDILNIKKDFKYDEKDLNIMYEYFTEKAKNPEKTNTKKSRKKKENITDNINTRQDAEKHYFEHMIYDRNDEKAEKKVLKNHLASDLKKIYSLIYDSNPPSLNKTELLNRIHKYFDNIKRAKSLQ